MTLRYRRNAISTELPSHMEMVNCEFVIYSMIVKYMNMNIYIYIYIYIYIFFFFFFFFQLLKQEVPV